MRSFDRISSRYVCWSFILLSWLVVAGCKPETVDESVPDYTKLVPAKGTVKVKGKAVPGVVVTFLPSKWAASNGETGDDGSYTLQTAGKPGVLPGEYKVAFSYLVSAEGQPQGLAPRSAMNPPPSMASAREKLPPEFSDLGRTTFKATVSASGGTFDFDIPFDLESQ